MGAKASQCTNTDYCCVLRVFVARMFLPSDQLIIAPVACSVGARDGERMGLSRSKGEHKCPPTAQHDFVRTVFLLLSASLLSHHEAHMCSTMCSVLCDMHHILFRCGCAYVGGMHSVTLAFVAC